MIYSKELTHVIVEAWQAQNLQGLWRPWEEVLFEAEGNVLAEFPFP